MGQIRAKKTGKKKAKKKRAARKKAPPPAEVEEDAEEEETPPEPTPMIANDNPFDLGGSPERGRARLHEISAEMGRVWGTHTAMPMSMAPSVNIQRMPVGILEFDYRTGGGLIIGRCNRVKGRKDTLKSTFCLKAFAAAQRTCRHCKWRLVTDPITGRINCRCPEHRFWVAKEEDYAWLKPEDAIPLFHGHLPEGATMTKIKGVGRVPALVCEPPPHLKGKRGIKKRPIPFAEQFRCEPMRCGLLDTEHTTDVIWAKHQGVDPGLVEYSNAKWAEQGLEAVERMALKVDGVDFIVIDSTSMMETREHLEDRQVGERGTPAGKQKIMGDFIKRIIAAQVADGVTARYSPTLLTTSHLTTKGIGQYGVRPYLEATDGLIAGHGFALDVRMRAERFIFDAAKQKAIYGVYEFTIDKNHCGGMGSTKTKGQIKYWLVDTPDHPVGDSNDLATVMDYARDWGSPFISEGRGASKLVLHSEFISGGRKPFSSVSRCRKFLRENVGIYEDLRSRVLTKLIDDRETLQVIEEDEPEGAEVQGD